MHPTESADEEPNPQSNERLEDEEKERRTVTNKEGTRASPEPYKFEYHCLKCNQYVKYI